MTYQAEAKRVVNFSKIKNQSLLKFKIISLSQMIILIKLLTQFQLETSLELIIFQFLFQENNQSSIKQRKVKMQKIILSQNIFKVYFLFHFIHSDLNNIICYQNNMKTKINLLSDLKKQVIILKTQLDNIQRHKNKQNRSTSSCSKSFVFHSSRFNSSSCDSTYLDKGVKKFALGQQKFKNLSQVIGEKSAIQKRPKLSLYRKAEDQKTKQNFSTQKMNLSTSRNRSPNPLTGEGYSQKKKGIKTAFSSREPQQPKVTSKKHFPLFMCR